MAKRITELDALTGAIANTDLFIMVDSAESANAESKSVKYETLRDSVKTSVTNTALSSIAYTASNTTFNFNRADSGTVTLKFNPSINASSDVSISGITTGEILKWDGNGFVPGSLEVNALSDATTINIAEKDILVHNGSHFEPKSHTNIAQTNPVRLTVSSSTLPSGEQVTLTGVGGMTEVNNNNYYVNRINSTTYDLYSDSQTFNSVDGTGYTAFTSGGLMTAVSYRSYEPVGHTTGEILQVQSHILPGNVTYGVTNTYIDGPTTHRFDFTPKSTNSTVIYRLSGWLGTGTSTGTNIQGQTGRNLGLMLKDYTANQIIDANDYTSGGHTNNVPNAPQVNWISPDGGGGQNSVEFIFTSSATTTMKLGLQVITGGTNTESYVVWGNDAKAQSEHNRNVPFLTVTITEIQN